MPYYGGNIPAPGQDVPATNAPAVGYTPGYPGAETGPKFVKTKLRFYFLLPIILAVLYKAYFYVCNKKQHYEGEPLINITKFIFNVALVVIFLNICLRLDGITNWTWA